LAFHTLTLSSPLWLCCVRAGIPIYFSNLSSYQSVAVLVFASMMTPLGVGIGMAVSETQGIALHCHDQSLLVLARCHIDSFVGADQFSDPLSRFLIST
jgi:hypothetical protein